MQPVEPASVFISYSSKDAQIVHPLGLLLRASGSSPFVDQTSLQFGEDWRASIDRAISQCATMLVFWSEGAAASREVAREYEMALSIRKSVVPVMISDAPPLPPPLARLHGVPLLQMFRHWVAEDAENSRKHAEFVKQNPEVMFSMRAPWESWASRIESAIGIRFHHEGHRYEQRLAFDVPAQKLMHAAKALAN